MSVRDKNNHNLELKPYLLTHHNFVSLIRSLNVIRSSLSARGWKTSLHVTRWFISSNFVLSQQMTCSVRKPIVRWVHACNVTAYRITISLECGRDSWPRNVSKVGYAVTLRACSVRRRYLTVASKAWYGYGLSRSGRAMWHVTTVRSSRLLYIHDASGSHNKLGIPWCNACRILLRYEARDESSDRNSVSCQSLATLRRYGTR
jgi:hypothetical protein